MRAIRKLPAIVSDIDGVLYLGHKPIPKSDSTLRFLRRRLDTIGIDIGEMTQALKHPLIPFVAMTNGGGQVETKRAELLNGIFNLGDYTKDNFRGTFPLLKENIALNFSSLRPELERFRDKFVLFSGIGDLESIGRDIGMRRFIHVDELCTLFPELVPLARRDIKERTRLLPIIMDRFQISDQTFFEEPFPIDAVFILNDVLRWEESCQVILDYLSTSDGSMARKFPPEGPQPHIPIFAVNPDILYADHFRLPRLAGGTIHHVLQMMYHKVYKKDLTIEVYGKPELKTFKYVEKMVESLIKREALTNIYMIGDNPDGDIKGANQIGWTSILVRSGIYKGAQINVTPHYIVDTFYDAVQLIFEKEGLPFHPE
eukprot:TRINITY_DN9163_c0_g3_i2.p1 TRINITY_DN9163_c0_g3~~TRINITY_DN9163_c0_g3_i2.p1  ORF type:complete len:371 (-),score=67.37 TRINITY_DN9163_c0_g3_i2:159-1271(-)